MRCALLSVGLSVVGRLLALLLLAAGVAGCGAGGVDASVVIGGTMRTLALTRSEEEGERDRVDVVAHARLRISERAGAAPPSESRGRAHGPPGRTDGALTTAPCASALLCAWEGRETARALARYAAREREEAAR